MVKYFYLAASAVLLLITAWVLDRVEKDQYTQDNLVKITTANLEREFSAVRREGLLLLNDSASNRWSSAKHSFFLVNDHQVLRWSSNEPAVDTRQLLSNDTLRLLQTSRLDLLLYKRPAGKGRWLIGIIPLRISYSIVNRYLTPSWNDRIFTVKEIGIHLPGEESGSCVSLESKCLFKIEAPEKPFQANYLSLALVAFSLLLVMVALTMALLHWHRRRKYLLVFVGLFVSLAIVRVGMVQFSIPSRWMYSAFFDSRNFASSSFNSSLGDLFLNSLIVAISCVYLFLVYTKTGVVKTSLRLRKSWKPMVAAILLTASYFSFLFSYLYVESIFHDSSIPFDLSASVHFDSLRVLAYSSWLLGSLSSFFFVHVFVRWAKALTANGLQFMASLVLAGLLFLVYFLASDLNYWITFFVGTGYFLLLYFTSFYFSLSSNQYRSFLFLLMSIVIYCVQSAWGVKHFAEQKKVKSMFRWAESLISHDVLAEYLLNEAAARISEDPFIAASISNPLLSKHGVRQKIHQQYLNSYLNRYEVKIDLFMADGNPADGETVLNFASTIRRFENEANKTGFANVYLINGLPGAVKQYFVVIPVERNKSSRGFALLTLSLKRIIPHQVYPELLVDGRFSQALGGRDFSYRFFDKDSPINNFGNFNFDRDFNDKFLGASQLYREGINEDGTWFTGAEDEAGRRVVVASPAYASTSVLANFSFLFVLGVLILFLVLAFYGLSPLTRFSNYSTRIQLYLYAAFILPLIAVSILSLRMISQSNESQLEKEVQEKGSLIADEISGLHDSFPDSVNFISGFQQRLNEIAQSTSTEANVYNLTGELIASSQPSIFKNGLVMPLIDRGAWERITQDKFNNYKTQCFIGTLAYNSSFFPIKSSANGRLMGVLELPFFESSSEGARITALSNILVTFALVFILFSLLTVNAMHQLTSPLRFIAKKLKTTTLQNNQPIEWKSEDEIGLMVAQYNRMLENLEKNRVDLVKIQKEQAWREIAQQVAHEIKNPLTPMKLTIQHMEQSANADELTRDRIKKSLQTLLEQVEILNGIAGSFSAFASMPAPVLGQVELNELLTQQAALFANQPDGVVHFEKSNQPLYVVGDEKLLSRIFSNLVINGLQASREKSSPRVSISLDVDADNCTVAITDNGSGISPEFQDRIFLPHFSTKKTGSGLGLAIAKQGLEHMGASIWFNTSAKNGTTFFVKFKKLDPSTIKAL
jgi:signal transduction histidine kinase